MTVEHALAALVEHLLDDSEVVSLQQWHKLVMVGVVAAGTARMFGYCFDSSGNWEAAAPRSARALDFLRTLREQMREAHAAHRAWTSCLIVIHADGSVALEPEYERADRWAVTPRNLIERIDQFRATSGTERISLRPAAQ
jgi:hypothetical protein